jgi:hypothetical protein
LTSLLLIEFKKLDDENNPENGVCSVEGCMSKIRTKKYGLCTKHETRLRNHGDTTVNKREEHSVKPLILPSGVVIRDRKKIKLLKEIVSEIKKRRLYGYGFEEIATKSYISDILDDKIFIRGRKPYSGTNTTRYYDYLKDISQKYDSEWGLISIDVTRIFSSIVKEICKNEKYLWEDVENNFPFYCDDIEKIISTTEIHGIKLTDSGELVFVESFNDILTKIFNFENSSSRSMTFPSNCHLFNLHYERFCYTKTK